MEKDNYTMRPRFFIALIIAVLLLVLCSVGYTAKAEEIPEADLPYSFTVEIDGKSVFMRAYAKYIYVLDNNDDQPAYRYCVYSSDSPFEFTRKTDDNGRLWITCGASGAPVYVTYYTKEFEYYATNYGWSDGTVFNSGIESIILGKMRYASYDIYDTDGNMVFQKPPVLSTLGTAVKKVELGLTMTEVIGMIPYGMALVVFLVGFRKGWRALSTVLHKA